MWMTLAVLVFFPVDVHSQDRASFRESNDRSGVCQYTFTVDTPVETSCSSTMEAENLSARVTLLEAMVSRVLGDGAVTETEEVRQLRRDKDQLDRQVKELQRQVEELTMETEKLREKPCPLIPHSKDIFGVNRGNGEHSMWFYGLENLSREAADQGEFILWK